MCGLLFSSGKDMMRSLLWEERVYGPDRMEREAIVVESEAGRLQGSKR